VPFVGAGLSGIGAARHLQAQSPHTRWALVEGRERIVGPSLDLLNDERVAALYLGRHTGKQAVGETN
jgi:monoamine oxidase